MQYMVILFLGHEILHFHKLDEILNAHLVIVTYL